jgi:hypothetical protein
MAPICAREQAPQIWYRLTGVRLVRHTSVDHCGRLLGRVSVLCATHVAAPLFFGSPCRAVCLHRRASHVGTGAAAAPDTNSVFDVDKIAEVDLGRISGTRVGAVAVGMNPDCKVMFTSQDVSILPAGEPARRRPSKSSPQ